MRGVGKDAVGKVIARCQREEGCPLYHGGDRVEFANVAVTGLDHAPVCFRAVVKFMPILEGVRLGNPPWNYDGASCGGCEHGQAWFTFTAKGETSRRTAGRFEEFALSALGTMRLLQGVHASVLRRIVPLLGERAVRAGDVLARVGEKTGALYFIVNGSFDVSAQGRRNVLTLGPGECIGAMALVTGEPSAATVTAVGVGQLLEVVQRDFPTLLTLVPTLGLGIARDLLHRLARLGTTAQHEGIMGRFEVVGPAELVQGMNLNRQTGLLTVEQDGVRGTLSFDDGALTNARIGELSNEDAFFAFVRWTRGMFSFEQRPPVEPRAIRTDTVAMLLEALRRLDEAAGTQSAKL